MVSVSFISFLLIFILKTFLIIFLLFSHPPSHKQHHKIHSHQQCQISNRIFRLHHHFQVKFLRTRWGSSNQTRLQYQSLSPNLFLLRTLSPNPSRHIPHNKYSNQRDILLPSRHRCLYLSPLKFLIWLSCHSILLHSHPHFTNPQYLHCPRNHSNPHITSPRYIHYPHNHSNLYRQLGVNIYPYNLHYNRLYLHNKDHQRKDSLTRVMLKWDRVLVFSTLVDNRCIIHNICFMWDKYIACKVLFLMFSQLFFFNLKLCNFSLAQSPLLAWALPFRRGSYHFQISIHLIRFALLCCNWLCAKYKVAIILCCWFLATVF